MDRKEMQVLFESLPEAAQVEFIFYLRALLNTVNNS